MLAGTDDHLTRLSPVILNLESTFRIRDTGGTVILGIAFVSLLDIVLPQTVPFGAFSGLSRALTITPTIEP